MYVDIREENHRVCWQQLAERKMLELTVMFASSILHVPRLPS